MALFGQKRPRYGEDPNFMPNTVIGEGVTMMGGVIKGVNSVLVSGLVFGDINVDGEVIVTETGYVKGDIISTFAVIAGIVEGNMRLSSYASLKATASVTGDVSCTAINIEDGAVFTGMCNMIIKSNLLTKKLKRINETAASIMEDKFKELKANAGEDLEAQSSMSEEQPGIGTYDGPEPVWYSLDSELEDGDAGTEITPEIEIGGSISESGDLDETAFQKTEPDEADFNEIELDGTNSNAYDLNENDLNENDIDENSLDEIRLSEIKLDETEFNEKKSE